MSKTCYTYKEAQTILGPYDDTIDFMGPKGAEQYVPRHIVGICMNTAAYEHDLAYIMGGGEEEKIDADIAFMAMMMYEVETHKFWWGTNWLLKSIARKQVMWYYTAVVAGGARSFCYIQES